MRQIERTWRSLYANFLTYNARVSDHRKENVRYRKCYYDQSVHHARQPCWETFLQILGIQHERCNVGTYLVSNGIQKSDIFRSLRSYAQSLYAIVSVKPTKIELLRTEFLVFSKFHR